MKTLPLILATTALTTLSTGAVHASCGNGGGPPSNGCNNRSDYGVSIGINIPLGAGQFRDAAENEIQARADRTRFRLIQEAVWLRDQGLLTQEAHPRHYAALHGTSFKF